MSTYKVFSSQTGDFEAVKQGWSWPGFFFVVFWALAKGLRALALRVILVLLGIQLVLIALASRSSNPLETAQAFAVMANISGWLISFVFGAFGNGWRESNLIDRGYGFRGTVSGVNPKHAVSAWRRLDVESRKTGESSPTPSRVESSAQAAAIAPVPDADIKPIPGPTGLMTGAEQFPRPVQGSLRRCSNDRCGRLLPPRAPSCPHCGQAV